MYWEYVKEREGLEVLETEFGFALWRLESDELLYLQDIYVKPEHRKSGYGRKMLEMLEHVAKQLGVKYIQGSVCPGTNGATESMKSLLATGFRLTQSDSYLIYFVKDVP